MFKPLASLLAASVLLMLPSAIAAQQAALPPLIRIVVPAVAGSGTDALARAVGAQLASRTGSNVIVENKPGASTMIGSAAVAKGPKDGSMLLISTTTLLTTGAMMKEPMLDVVNDLMPVAMLQQHPLVVAVSIKSNIKTPAELIAAARAAPGTITHGSAGTGTIAHVAQVMLEDAAGVKLTHVPYKGTAPAVMDMASGIIDVVIATNATVAPGIRSGRARVIAVTSLQPSPAFPGLPTMASVAPGFSLDLWTGFFVSAGTPALVVKRLNQEINEIAKSDKLREMMTLDGGVPLPLTPDELGPLMRESFAKFKKLAMDKNITVE